MWQIITGSANYLFPGGKLLKLVKNGANLTTSINPLILTKNITLTVVDCCVPPTFKLAAHCLTANMTIAVSIVSPNPVTIESAFITEIYENC